MKLTVNEFKGEVPRLSSRALPDQAAQTATNCRLLSTDLSSWNEKELTDENLGKKVDGVITSIFPLDITEEDGGPYWLHWLTDVTTVRGPVPLSDQRTYIAAGDEDVPRVTNFTLATNDGDKDPGPPGDQKYPYIVYKLGVPAGTPAPTLAQTFDVTTPTLISDGSSIDDWTTNTQTVGLNYVDSYSGDGNPASCIRLINVNAGAPPAYQTFLYQDLGSDGGNFRYLKFDFKIDAASTSETLAVFINADLNGKGTVLQLQNFPTQLNITTATATAWDSSISTSVGPSHTILTTPYGVWYTCIVTMVFNQTTLKYDSTLVIKNGATTIGTFTDYTFDNDGTFLGFRQSGAAAGVYSNTSYIDNIYALQDSATTEVVTNYVFTYVNGFNEEGPPSDPSDSVTVDSGISTTVTTSVANPGAEYNIVSKNIYRAVTGTISTQYQFVANIPLATADYVDTTLDEDLEPTTLPSTGWDLPPSDGFSIIAMANGITAMASGNQVCPSVLNRPHAYPESYRLTTDYDIVAMGVIDNLIVVATQANPYLVIGADPETLSMSKLEESYGCVSRRSLVTIRDWGVVYASPNGLIGIRNAGVQNITDGFYSRKEWQELMPETIHAVAHDGRYFGFYDNGSFSGGFLFDPRELGNGLIHLNFFPSACFSNPINDKLYFVVDGDLYVWDNDTTSLLPYIWKSKRFILSRAANFRIAQIRRGPTGTLTFKMFAEGTQYFSKTITNDEEFVTPALAVKEFEFQLEGTAPVEQVEIAEDVEELT